VAPKRVCFYRAGRIWRFTIWVDGRCDRLGKLDVEEDASEDDAVAAAHALVPRGIRATFTRVADVPARERFEALRAEERRGGERSTA
jgi:hypothetical protein